MKAAEKRRLLALQQMEKQVHREGYRIVAGLDEAGHGPLAGPVMAAVCYIPEDILIPGVADSKVLQPEQRAAIFSMIKERQEIIWAVGEASHEEIDAINIFQASKLAMQRALQALAAPPDFLLIDGFNMPEVAIPQKKVIKGDALSYCIAAASIIAKETRDARMRVLHEQFPAYNFAQHKGYATPEHKALLQQFGPCPIHRRTFLTKTSQK